LTTVSCQTTKGFENATQAGDPQDAAVQQKIHNVEFGLSRRYRLKSKTVPSQPKENYGISSSEDSVVISKHEPCRERASEVKPTWLGREDSNFEMAS
jgi:hypothetical protein